MPPALVSVVIPTYGEPRHLSGALQSALGQTYQPLEVVVVSDGQNTVTDELMGQYADRVHYHSMPHAGASATRNRGLQLASGRYVLFLDADDLLHGEAVAWLMEEMEAANDRVCILGYARFENEGGLGGSELQQVLPPQDAPPMAYLIRRNFAAIHSVLSPRELVLAAGGFATDLRWCEDWDLWLRLALMGAELRTVSRVGAFYRQTPGSMSSRVREMLEGRAEVVLRTHQRLLHSESLTRQWAQAVVETEHLLLRQCLTLGLGRELQRRLWNAMQDMTARGYRPPQSSAKRLSDRFLGLRSELLTVAWYRVFDRRRFAYYQHH